MVLMQGLPPPAAIEEGSLEMEVVTKQSLGINKLVK
jgi:hypothetical protein